MFFSLKFCKTTWLQPLSEGSALVRAVLLIGILDLVFVTDNGCARHRVVSSRPPRVSESEMNERVFKTNEEAVKAGLYEEFVDSMLLKGQTPSTAKDNSAAPPAVSPPAEIPEQSEKSTTGEPAADVLMGFRVQLGAFNDQPSAEALAARARERIGAKYAVYVRYYAPMWKVQVGDCRSRDQAQSVRALLQGLGYQDAWIVSSGIKR